MGLHTIFGFLSITFSIAAFAPYFWSIYKKETQPHLYSWTIWVLIQGTAVWIMFAEGAGWGVSGLTVGTFLCACVSLISLRYGTKNITRLDTFCLIGAFIAFAIYALVREPYTSLALVIFIELCGFFPTFRKAIADPSSETTVTWGIFSVSNVFSLLAIENVALLTVAYPAVLLITETSLAMLLVLLKRHTSRPGP